MSEFEDKLNAVLGDREAMGQIMALAQSLSSKDREEPPDGYVPVEEPAQTPALPSGDLSALLGDVDPKMMELGMRVLREYNRGDDRNAALLTALRPFVKEERFAKVDRAIKIARLSRVIRVLLDSFREKGEDRRV